MNFKIAMPLRIEIGKTKKKLQTINMNYYRNWNRFVEAQVKKRYQEIVCSILESEKIRPINKKINITYKLFKKTNAQQDKMNFLSIHDKYFCDALVKAKIIPDDSDFYIDNHIFLPSEKDKLCPRVEILVQW